MAQRPTVADLAGFLGLANPPDEGTNEYTKLTDSLDAALEGLEDIVRDEVLEDEDAYPRRLRLAVLMYANRLHKRSGTPEGVAGFGELGVVRMLESDPDMRRLIGRFLKLDGFA